MPLQRQVQPVLLKGLDQLAPKQTGIASGLDSLVNMVAQAGDQAGYEFVPRPGTTTIATPAGGTVGSRLATLGNQLLQFSSGGKLYRRVGSAWYQVAGGNFTSQFAISSQTTTPIYAEGVTVTSCDVAYVNGYILTASITSNGPSASTLNVIVTDTTGAALDISNGINSSSLRVQGGAPSQVRIAVSGTAAVVFWAETTTSKITCAKFDSTTQIFGAITTITSSASTAGAFNPIFDILTIPSSGLIAVMWNDSGTSNLTATLLNPSTMTTASTTAYAAKGTSFVTKCFLANAFSGASLAISYIASTGLHYDLLSSTTLAAGSTATLDATVTTGASLTGYATSSTQGVVFFTVKGTLPFDDIIKTSSTSSPSAVVFAKGRAIASRAADLSAGNTGLPLFLTKYRGVGQCTYFITDASPGQPHDISRSMPDIAAADPSNALVGLLALPNLMIGATSNTYLTSGLKSVSLQSGSGGITSNTGAAMITLVYGDSTVGRPVELNGALHIPGAMPLFYDGAFLTEEGFPIAPEQSDAYVMAAGGSMTPSSTYTYRYVWEWTDSTGALHQSAPNLLPQQAVLGAGQTQVTHSIPNLITSRKFSISVAIYRTVANGNGSAYYKVGSVSWFPTPVSVGRLTFTDTVSDAALVTGVPLYVDGGILENLSPPSCTSMAIHRGRLLAGGIDGDPTAIWFSKQVIPGFGIAFNDALVSRLNSANDTVTALGSMDSFAAAFTATTSWTSADDYPDDTGTSAPVLQFIQSSSINGCAGPRLIARTDDGLVCWQNKTAVTGGPGPGPWRFSRGSTWDWIGSSIQLDSSSLAPFTVLSVPGLNQLRVVGSTMAIVRESTFQTWATWTYLHTPLVDAIIWNGSTVYLCSDGNCLLENASIYDDSSIAIVHSITLSPFNFAGVAGYQRIYVGQLTGRILGASGSATLNITQTIDGVTMPDKSITLTPDANALFDGVEFDPGPNGKCSAYQVTISNALSGMTRGCAWTLAAVTMEVGVKPNLNRLPPSNRAL